MTALLEVDALDAGYGDFQALFGVSIDVAEGETVAIIGANGAGKTTLLQAVMGQVRVTGGHIRYAGNDLAGVPTHRRVERGLALVPEGRRLFPSLTVEENLLVGAHRGRPGTWTVRKVVEVFPLLERLLRRSAAKLSGGEQQAVAIGRALMTNPDLVLLDEVSLGLAPVVVRSLYGALPSIISTGTTVVLVEQDITLALDVADRAYCLLEGRVSLAGPPADLSREAITTAYFGM
jgi:branched-chain amino acid transport system ATP-binding protein